MKQGMLAGILAIVFAVLGILFLGFIFVPLAFIIAIIGTIRAVKAKEVSSIGVNVIGWILVIIGFYTSPVLLGIIGVGVISSSSGGSSRDDARASSVLMDIDTLVQASCANYQRNGKFGKPSDVMYWDTQRYGSDPDVSNGGVVDIQTLVSGSTNENCVTLTYSKDGKIEIKTNKKPKGSVCSKVVGSKNIEQIVDCGGQKRSSW